MTYPFSAPRQHQFINLTDFQLKEPRTMKLKLTGDRVRLLRLVQENTSENTFTHQWFDRGRKLVAECDFVQIT